MGFIIKKLIAWLFSLFGISEIMLKRLNLKYDNQYIRVVNYHNTEDGNKNILEKQFRWYRKRFININYSDFEKFMSGKNLQGNKPGLIITFDDGLKGNYDIARPLLEKYGFTGYFMCSSDLVGTDGYMDALDLIDLVKSNHVIGDHTATHHRMLESDTPETLNHEIAESKVLLEKVIDKPINIFCWCGGEEQHYTRKAYTKILETGYKYVFMTNSEPLTQNTDKLHIQRINIEDSWPIYLVKLQVCGFMDRHFKSKRERVYKKITIN